MVPVSMDVLACYFKLLLTILVQFRRLVSTAMTGEGRAI
jgi:hypothetical protein